MLGVARRPRRSYYHGSYLALALKGLGGFISGAVGFSYLRGATATYQHRTYRTPYILQFTECTGDYYNPYCNIEILVGSPSLW